MAIVDRAAGTMNTEQFLMLGNLLFISGLLLLFGGVLTWLRAHRMYSTWKSVNGMVTKVVSHSISSSDFHYYPVIEFQTKTGKSVIFESELGFYPAKHKQGQQVLVWYDEVNPDNAMLDLVAAKWTVPLALGAFGVIAIIIGAIILAVI
ncbi:MAG: DUF3592 domain-containing protein [Chloroflexia bacterium]|nr:DUF3592 domain-containing protein [Chloroflexia bacterium]